VLEALGRVYANDAEARAGGLSAAERLRLHQERSGPLMESLREWFEEQLGERKAEPNSGLGKAVQYFQRHWKALTLFLRQPGAPLDNNVCERALNAPCCIERMRCSFGRCTEPRSATSS
jgi:hypothetical protein